MGVDGQRIWFAPGVEPATSLLRATAELHTGDPELHPPFSFTFTVNSYVFLFAAPIAIEESSVTVRHWFDAPVVQLKVNDGSQVVTVPEAGESLIAMVEKSSETPFGS